METANVEEAAAMEAAESPVTPQTMVGQVVRPTIVPVHVSEDDELGAENMTDSGSDGELEVVKKMIGGKAYLMDEETYEVYDSSTYELIGTWNEAEDKVILTEV